MTKPITLSQKSRILDFLIKNNIATEEGIWRRLELMDAQTASFVIDSFYKKNIASALKQMQHLKVL